jgi:hypothetical protein
MPADIEYRRADGSGVIRALPVDAVREMVEARDRR